MSGENVWNPVLQKKLKELCVNIVKNQQTKILSLQSIIFYRSTKMFNGKMKALTFSYDDAGLLERVG